MNGVCDICNKENIEVKNSPTNPKKYVEQPDANPGKLNMCLNCYVEHMTYEEDPDDVIRDQAAIEWDRLK